MLFCSLPKVLLLLDGKSLQISSLFLCRFLHIGKAFNKLVARPVEGSVRAYFKQSQQIDHGKQQVPTLMLRVLSQRHVVKQLLQLFPNLSGGSLVVVEVEAHQTRFLLNLAAADQLARASGDVA